MINAPTQPRQALPASAWGAEAAKVAVHQGEHPAAGLEPADSAWRAYWRAVAEYRGLPYLP